MFRIGDLRRLAGGYLDQAEVERIHRAFLFGADAHDGQHRASGEPYIHHPVQVAKILAEMRLDHETIVAALLHDVIEDTPTAKPQIATEFGEAVAELVDGVSKLTHLSFENRAEAQAENFRKMLMAMARDIRVMLIKLADRLHNMRTLDALPLGKQRRIARETIEIYAPIANRLGLRSVRIELEDLGFRALYPRRYRVLGARVRKARGHRKRVVGKIETAMKRRLRQEGVKARVDGREKHLYSLYRKMRSRNLSFREVLDVYGFRIVVERPDDCYRALGMVHGLYKPVPERFKDYIALPKANGYQSLHTTLFGPFGTPIEVQVRTEEMHQVAESGVAAHWMYKTGQPGGEHRPAQGAGVGARPARDADPRRRFPGVSRERQGGSLPEGGSTSSPRPATSWSCPGARRRWISRIRCTPTSATSASPSRWTDATRRCVRSSRTGQTVEIVTMPWGRPNAAWLDFIVTGKARTAIRNHLKRLRAEEAIELGEMLLDQALAVESAGLDDVPAPAVDALLAELKLGSIQALFEEIGIGKRLAPLVAKRLTTGGDEPSTDGDSTPGSRPPLYIRGSEGMVVNFGKCCHPIPGDPVMGFVSAGRGLVIHTTGCGNLAEYADRRERWVEVVWEPGVDGEFPAEIRVDMANRKGVLATVAAAIAEMGANIDNVNIEHRDGLDSTLIFVIEVRDRAHLARIMRRIRGIGEVSRIARTGR